MKRGPKNYKALSSRFILVLIFILLIVNRLFAQCGDSDPTSTCHSSLNFVNSNNSCYATPGDKTDLFTTGQRNKSSVTITSGDEPDITNMTITQFTVDNITTSSICHPNYDGPSDNASYFTDLYGINFINNTSTGNPKSVTISVATGGIKTGNFPSGINYVSFTVNAIGTSATIHRRYTFKVVSNSYIVGDPHINTVDGVPYDFQSVGEFVALKGDSADNFEIQTRQRAVATNRPGAAPNNTTGLTTCVSLNTAVAARVGTHRVSYEPNINGIPDTSGMQLRVDSVLITLDENGLDLGSGGRIVKSPAGPGVIIIDFPDGASLTVTPRFWDAYSQWYLDLSISNTVARKGLMGVIPLLNFEGNLAQLSSRDRSKGFIRPRSWLPALPDGTSVGPMPDSTHDRFVVLYGNGGFADKWRVTDTTSLFDYKPGTSTATFTNKNWPLENADSCSLPGQTALTPIGLEVAQQLCRDIIDSNLRADAIFDVMITGDSGFAKSYLLMQRVKTGTTATTLSISKDTTKNGEPVTITATVYRKFSADKGLAGVVEFTVDGKKLDQVKLDTNGVATITTTSLEGGTHQIVATFTPDSGGTTFSSGSYGTTHTVIGNSPIWHHWWFWLILFIILLIIIFALRKKKP